MTWTRGLPFDRALWASYQPGNVILVGYGDLRQRFFVAAREVRHDPKTGTTVRARLVRI